MTFELISVVFFSIKPLFERLYELLIKGTIIDRVLLKLSTCFVCL